MQLQNDLIIKAATGQQVPRVPVWCMRQAGRVFPEYRAVRKKAGSFVEMVKHPEYCAEVTLQPIDLLAVDAAIIFSDILVVPEAMGLPYDLVEKVGPRFPETIKSIDDVERLRVPEPEQDLGYVLEAIRLTKQALNGRVPLIGFAGAPFTIFCYMVEGHGSKTFSLARKMMYQAPTLAHMLLKKITQSTIAYLKAQIKAGAQLVQVFDSWAGILGPAQYEAFAMPYLHEICNAINEVPVIVFSKGAFYARKSLAQLNCQVIGLDWHMDIAHTRQLVGPEKSLQGNLDPAALYGNFDQIKAETHKMLEAFGGQKHIANLGHGLYPDLKPDNVRCFVDTVKAWQPPQTA